MHFPRSWKPAIYACVAVLATQVWSVASAQRPAREQIDQGIGIHDVALVAGGTLRGTVVDAQGARLPHKTISISLGQISPGQYVAETRSDAAGEFRLNGLRGGLHVVSVDGARRALRVWAPGTAPPCAADQLLVVGGGDIVRGKLGSHSHHKWLKENAGQIAVIGAFIALPIVYATKPYGS